ncbi:TetR/AcrR family transcriptional regulator [Gordonia sp. (in: high G+C Gram-positive bacteria)]|uniref:TetR/AcrR family transcriptional regulator n=1 Tax=unclassified Gordonia (in: high G+C Gram-positive bacteria) TaxID=2657482 RepID=UPI00261338D5|nr:TetR/AcrR family transcriptional regulator [Gordonia sp. (in: high G+C Gram-positive bacteria)]
MGRPRTFDEDVVVARAMETFWTHGYAGTSPARLAEATGIAKGSLYNAFTSKRDLFDRCLDRYHRQIAEMAAELLERPGTTRDCFRAALRAVVDDDLAQPQRRGCLIGNTAVELAGEDGELARRLRRMQDESTDWFAERIRRGQRDGDVAAQADARALAEHFATVLAGLRVMAMTHDAPMLYRTIETALTVL